MCDTKKENLTMGQFIKLCDEKHKTDEENHYKELAMVFGKSDYWVDAKECSTEQSIFVTYIVQLNCIGYDMARSAIEYISPHELSIKGRTPDTSIPWYEITSLSDGKFEIRFRIKAIDGTTDFLFQELIKDLCKQANVNYSELF